MGYLFSWLSLSKSAAEHGLDFCEILIILAGLVLTLGAIGEYAKEHHKLPLSLRCPMWVFILMVVGGLIGEFVGDAGVFLFSGTLQTISDEEVAKLTKKANEADERSKKLEQSNRQLAIVQSGLDMRLEAERQKTARFQKEANDARLALENRVRTQGPRYSLLRIAAPKLAREMSKFAGQRAALIICGIYRKERETLETWGELANILGPETIKGVRGANWKMVRGDPIWDKCFLSMQGIAVMVSPESPKSTRDAAEALSKGLRNALPPYNNNPVVVKPWLMRQMIEQGVNVDKDDPARLATEDPNLIVVFIGEHPPQ
jgi:hypothetical protein